MSLVEDKKCAFVYVLECSDGSYYTGWSTDVTRRIAMHNTGRASKYTRLRRPVRLAYSEPHSSRTAAMRREAQIKGWSRARKEALVSSAQVHRSNKQ